MFEQENSNLLSNAQIQGSIFNRLGIINAFFWIHDHNQNVEYFFNKGMQQN